MQNKQEWNLKDTVYTEPDWTSLTFCRSIHGDRNGRQYDELKKAHQAILLQRGCSLIAVSVHPHYSDTSRQEATNESAEWYATFEDALDAGASRVHERLVEEQDQLTGVMLEIQRHRMEAAEAEQVPGSVE